MKNKGFSLVELIVVISIIAIMSAVLAPQVIKYIEKANIAHDIQNCKTIEKYTYALLSEDEYHDILANGYYEHPNGMVTNQLEYFIHPGDESNNFGTYNVKTDEYKDSMRKFLRKLKSYFRYEIEAPKQSGKKSYLVTINFKAVYDNDYEGNDNISYQIGDVTVKTTSMGNKEAKSYFKSKGYK